MRFIAIVVACVALAGCAAARSERLAAEDDAKCQSFGAQPGTPTYYNCRMNLEAQRSERRALKGSGVD